MNSEFVFDNGRNPEKGSGRRSYIVTAMVALLIISIVGLGVTGLVYLFGNANALSMGHGVGVVEIKGIITDSEEAVASLKSYVKSDKVAAIIIRIDSPGGGVAATQEIYREILKAKKEKPVIASLGGMAASGGLYVAAATDKIMANPASVTGSIGVIMQLVNYEELLDKVGFRPVVIKSVKYKDIGSPARAMTDEERALLQRVVDQLHQQFIRDLARGRSLEESKVTEFADGRLITGEEALKLGLVDKLGNFEDAVKLAKEITGASEDLKVFYPQEKKSWLKEILRGENPFKQVIPAWTSNPVSFQFLYLPGA